MVGLTKEELRQQENRLTGEIWRKWGPYLSERQWGTVREDYSENGNAWDYFTHDQARSRAYRWGEDGLGGISDDQQLICFALALWNGQDPILKERLFGLSNSEANHGEDVKEYYYYLDSTPTHSYMKYLYKYPQAAFPYDDLVQTNKNRSRKELEYELIDTGIFDENRYFDVFIEYAKAGPQDILIQIEAINRGPESAEIDLLPTLWFRNTWWMSPELEKPRLKLLDGQEGHAVIAIHHPDLGTYYLYAQSPLEMLFTENETNNQRLFGQANSTPYVKDGINNYLLHGDWQAVNPANIGTKASAHYKSRVDPGQTCLVRIRLSIISPEGFEIQNLDPLGSEFQETMTDRKMEADEFYNAITPDTLTPDEQNVMRQALAGMMWGKQFYYFDLDRWLEEHDANPLAGGKRMVRNRSWYHMLNAEVISMPDKWEYPWYAAWDLAFHALVLNIIDIDFARDQLLLMLRELYLHPSGQIPAYEWNFGDVNPPVHAWATLFTYSNPLMSSNQDDIEFLKSAFPKLMMNFTWWVNRKDPTGRNVFEGGFLGLDNIGVFDRSAPLPTGGSLEQADGTAWMAFFCLNMFAISIVLARQDASYEDMALKFLEHFFYIAAAMDRMGDHEDELWDETDEFFYDLLRFPDGSATRLKVRSMVGLLPLCAVTVIPGEVATMYPSLTARIVSRLKRSPGLIATIHNPSIPGHSNHLMFSVLNEDKLRKVLRYMLDEKEFLSDYGIRSLSYYHQDHPYMLNMAGEVYKVAYLPAESDTGMFGGNSNWRGPIWFPVNILILRSLFQYYTYYGDDFKIECPTGSGQWMTLFEVAKEIGRRLSNVFLVDQNGKRPVFGGTQKFHNDPHWRDYVFFYEYFHGDNGAGLGASHQTGWTGLVAMILKLLGTLTPEAVLAGDIGSALMARNK
jgi:hypothetical protein